MTEQTILVWSLKYTGGPEKMGVKFQLKLLCFTILKNTNSCF